MIIKSNNVDSYKSWIMSLITTFLAVKQIESIWKRHSLFCGRHSDCSKGVQWIENGFLLLYRCIESGSFVLLMDLWRRARVDRTPVSPKSRTERGWIMWSIRSRIWKCFWQADMFPLTALSLSRKSVFFVSDRKTGCSIMRQTMFLQVPCSHNISDGYLQTMLLDSGVNLGIGGRLDIYKIIKTWN